MDFYSLFILKLLLPWCRRGEGVGSLYQLAVNGGKIELLGISFIPLKSSWSFAFHRFTVIWRSKTSSLNSGTIVRRPSICHMISILLRWQLAIELCFVARIVLRATQNKAHKISLNAVVKPKRAVCVLPWTPGQLCWVYSSQLHQLRCQIDGLITSDLWRWTSLSSGLLILLPL